MPSAIKEKMLKETIQKMEGHPLFFAQFSGLEVSDLEKLRKDLKKVSEHVLVAKNTIARKALEHMNAKEAVPFLDGAILMVASKADFQSVSKLLVAFAKEKENFGLKGAFIDGGAQSVSYIKALASLPSRQALIGKVVCGIKSPITSFVLTLGALNRNFVVVLNEIKKKKESASPAQSS